MGEVSPAVLAHLFYDLAKSEASFLGLLRLWQLHDPGCPNFDEGKLQPVTEELQRLFRDRRRDFLDSFGPCHWVASWICWDFVVTPEILCHTMQEASKREMGRHQLGLGWLLARSFNLGKGGTARAQMQLDALWRLVMEDLERAEPAASEFRRWRRFCYVLGMLLLMITLPISLPVSIVHTSSWVNQKLVHLMLLIFWACLILCAYLTLHPYRHPLWVHGLRVARLYFTLIATKFAPCSVKILMWGPLGWQVKRTYSWWAREDFCWEPLLRILLAVALSVVFALMTVTTLEPRVHGWVSTLKPRIPLMEARLHLELSRA
ncbi:unnamed protein product [Durusdinium trenchii]|uniref:Uncharacterized protein n=1 Tax=Durusdinium trenchii TaxID=1381693 RepID=A0ABP0K5M5_9DINO